MSIDIDAKLQAVALILEGRVLREGSQIPVNVRGSILGFPAILKAFNVRWPFGVSYFLETEVIEDPNRTKDKPIFNLSICPRHGHSLRGLISKLLLLESRGMPINDKRLESEFIFGYDDAQMSQRFMKYPGVADIVEKLQRYSKFTELQIKSDGGLFLSQPSSFESLDLDVCKETFKLLGELGQIIFETF